MFLDDPKTRKQLTKWAVGTVAACILIFLGVRYVSAIAIAVRWLYDLVKPLLTGTILAMVLNVPLAFIEKHLFRKIPHQKKKKPDGLWRFCSHWCLCSVFLWALRFW